MGSNNLSLVRRRSCGLLTVVAMVLVTVLASCGSGDDSTDTSSTIPEDGTSTSLSGELTLEPGDEPSTSTDEATTSTAAATTTTEEATTTTAEAPSETTPPPEATDTTAGTFPTTDTTSP